MAPKKRSAKSAKPAAKRKSAGKKSAARPAPAPGPSGFAYMGEIAMFGFNFAPTGWLPCGGQILSIAQNQALFSLLGTQYGGDGRTTFALPKMAVPNSQGQGYYISTDGMYPTRQ